MTAGTLVAGILTLAILSFLYRDNPFYKAAEYLLVGVAVGYVLVITWSNTVMASLVTPLADGSLWLLLPLVLGLLMLARFSDRTGVWSRIPLAVMIGSGAGAAIPAMLGPRVLTQLSDTIVPLWQTGSGVNWNGILILIGFVSTLGYFYFSRPHEGSLGWLSRFGTYFLMTFFGATFGYTVMSRMSTLVGRMEFLLSDFLHLTR